MGKNGRFGKDYGKVVGKDHPSRPGWKGPSFTKKSEPSAKPKAKAPLPEDSNAIPEPVVPTKLQQLLLDVFKNAFSEILAADTLQPLLQDVKAALFDRDFSRAFGKQEYLQVYSVRWSPSRALCYASILVDIQEHLSRLLSLDTGGQDTLPSPDSAAATPKSTLKAVCIGGGAAEVVALGGYLKFLLDTNAERIVEALNNMSLSDSGPRIDLRLVDSAPWGEVVQMLSDGLTTPPPLSKYASASAREANSSLIPDGSITTTFQANDVFDMSQVQLDDIVGKGPVLITLFFTLNELYTASIGKTTALLMGLTLAAKPGTLLLFVDSPGSYSETTVGKDAKKYPIQWLLDHALLGQEKRRGGEDPAGWAKVFSDDSRWFRIPEGLRYSIPLENMRYQISLYRRI